MSAKDMHKMIKALTGMKRCTSSGCTENKDDNIIVGNMAFIMRWSEYILGTLSR